MVGATPDSVAATVVALGGRRGERSTGDATRGACQECGFPGDDRNSTRSADTVARVELRDEYTGHVDPAGPAARRDLDEVSITKVSVGPMDNNAYVVVDRGTGEALLIDAANETERLLDTIDTVADRGKLTALATTHKHWDHIQSLEDVARATAPRTYAHERDAPELPVAPDVTVTDDDTVPFGNTHVQVIHLDGHTPGSIALLYRDPRGTGHLFTGDSLFPGGPGRTTSPEDFTSLMDNLEGKVFGHLDDDTWVYPGHGDDTTLGAERPHLPEWRERGW